MALSGRIILTLLATVFFANILTSASWSDTGNQPNPFKGQGPWFDQNEAGEVRLHLYFFWSNKCPHCKRAKPFLEKLQRENPWVLLQELEVTENPENARRFAGMVQSIGETSRAVPALMFCGGMVQGFDREENSGARLLKLLTQCRGDLTAYLAPPEPMPEMKAQKEPPPSSGGISSLAVLAGLFVGMAGAAIYWRMNGLKK